MTAVTLSEFITWLLFTSDLEKHLPSSNPGSSQQAALGGRGEFDKFDFTDLSGDSKFAVWKNWKMSNSLPMNPFLLPTLQWSVHFNIDFVAWENEKVDPTRQIRLNIQFGMRILLLRKGACIHSSLYSYTPLLCYQLTLIDNWSHQYVFPQEKLIVMASSSVSIVSAAVFFMSSLITVKLSCGMWDKHFN